MADDHKLRFPRSDTPYPLGAAAERMERAPNSDPLAELARLIGQDNVFDQMRKDAGRAQTPGQPNSGHEPPRGSYGPAGDNRRPQYDESAETQTDYATRMYIHNQPAHDGNAVTPGYPEPYYADGPADPHPVPAQESVYDDGYDDAAEPLPERRRGGLVTVAVVLGLAVVGTAAAFGYRAFMGGGESAPPPVIAADKTPAKIVPAPSNTDGQTGRVGYDRADKSQPEKVVPREEQPIEMRETKAAAPKMMGPSITGSTGVGAPAQGAAPLASPSSMPALANPNEPKKVRTFAIRPDGSVAPDSMGAKAQNPGPARGAAPTQTTPTQPTPARPSPAPRPGASLQPGSQGQPVITAQGEVARTPASVPTQVASIRPTESPAATRTTMPIASGSHVVQLASQKSEIEAQASFRSMQAKYPTVLAGRQPLIRRVDLGDRGTYYRAQVGPFSSVDQANELCSNLKAAGGQCIVQRN